MHLLIYCSFLFFCFFFLQIIRVVHDFVIVCDKSPVLVVFHIITVVVFITFFLTRVVSCAVNEHLETGRFYSWWFFCILTGFIRDFCMLTIFLPLLVVTVFFFQIFKVTCFGFGVCHLSLRAMMTD